MRIQNITTGFVAVLVGYTSSAAIIFQAANAAGATPEQISSWLGTLGFGMGITSIGLSLYYRNPILTAWSTPGAALLVTSLSGVPISDAIGAFLFSGLLIFLSGATRLFERVMDRIPLSLASAMLAGVLLRFGLDVFLSMKTQFLLAFGMFVAYLICKRWLPRYAIILVLGLGTLLAGYRGLLHFTGFHLGLTVPVFINPTFSLSSIVGIGIPLFVVTMASQNIPGVAVIRASGYQTPVSPLITWTGIANLLLAPFGGFAINLAAITAAICMGEEADPNPKKRYLAAVSAGIFYLIAGIFGATVAALFEVFPKELVVSIAGLALFSTIGSNLTSAMKEPKQREPALITFLVTASGISLGGIGAAFWGLVAGVFSLAIFYRRG